MIRKVRKTDIPEIIELYKEVFGIDVSKEEYNYWYYNKKKNEYYSLVFIDNKKICGHNAIIQNIYKYRGEPLNIGLCSGGMVLPEKSGIFYKVLKSGIADFNGNLIIAFPNKNSIGFFKRIFDFNSIQNTYYSLKEKASDIDRSLPCYLQRTNEFIEWRVHKNRIRDYEIYNRDSVQIIYKTYLDNELDIIYVSSFGRKFIEFVNDKQTKFDKINILHWNQEYMNEIGFEKASRYNEFVFKNLTEKEIKFEFQMIDSDVF